MKGDKDQAIQKIFEDCRALIGRVYPGESKVLVPGDGRPGAEIFLLGEAPGEQETIQRKPFVGRAGANLDAFLQDAHIDREKLYVTNVVKFRPVKVSEKGRMSNRPPNREEIALCRPFLSREIAVIRPRLVVTLGNVALRAALGDDKATIGALHGQRIMTDNLVDVPGRWEIFALYHPASIIYNRQLRPRYEADIRLLAEYVQEQEC
nr:uracil-DNA glycosylase [bacterium]